MKDRHHRCCHDCCRLPAIYHAKWGHDALKVMPKSSATSKPRNPAMVTTPWREILASDDLANPRATMSSSLQTSTSSAVTLGALGKEIPIVIGHSAITDFARPTLRRPLIIKFHHDFLLSPKATPRMSAIWKMAIRGPVRDFPPVYAHRHRLRRAMMAPSWGFLKICRENRSRRHLWCWRKGDPPGKRIEDVVAKQAGTLIEISGFDELMTLLEGTLGHVFDPGKLSQRAPSVPKNYYRERSPDKKGRERSFACARLRRVR